MYTRLNSRRMPSMVLRTDCEWELANDKSCVLLQANQTEDGLKAELSTERHAAHVLLNPALGTGFQIITPDDGVVSLKSIPKAKQDVAVDWHYKVFIVRIDLPPV